MNLCNRVNDTNKLTSVEKQNTVILTKPVSNIIVYDNTTGIFIADKLIKMQYKYADGSTESISILEGVFTSVDWNENVSTAINKRIVVLLKSDGILIEYTDGEPIYDEDYIPLKQKVSLID